MNRWTLFWDMNSGGGTKQPPYTKIYIEASADQAKVIFYNRFGHNPERVSCTCCGEDYHIKEYETLAAASEYHRERGYPVTSHTSVEEYVEQTEVLVIRASEIKDSERTGTVPEQGYKWMG